MTTPMEFHTGTAIIVEPICE